MGSGFGCLSFARCGLVCDCFCIGMMPFYRGGHVRFSVSLGTCFLYDCLWGTALLEINS